MNSNESKQYDCSRGCTVERAESGEVECNYRQGCCKLEVYDWLQGVNQEQFNQFFEVASRIPAKEYIATLPVRASRPEIL